MTEKVLEVAVVVGYHTYEVKEFQKMFETFPGIHFYIQHLEQFTSSSKKVRESYDAVVFYVMQHKTPVNDGPWYEGAALDAMDELGRSGQGILILHHSLLAFENWKKWSDLTGLNPEKYRDYRLDVPMQYHVEKPDHPVMRTVRDFSMVDESYDCDGVWDVPGVEVLLTTQESSNISTVAWTKMFGKSRVLCYQSGHGSSAYTNENFRRILYQGICWLAGKGEE